MKTPTCFLALLLTCLPTAVRGQDKKIDPAKLLGQTPETGSLPFWSQPSADARRDLGQAARAAQRGVFLVGHPKVGTGTAWVVSKKNRLLVTNAHVADLLHETGGKMLAIPSGTSQVYRVEKVWYPPGVRRFLKNSATLSVRSSDPADGPIDPKSPDLALLQLAADGPELTVEFPLATSKDLAELFAQPVAIFGFPGHDTKAWPALGEGAAGTYHDGVVSRLTDFEMRAGGPEAERQFVQYTMATWSGFSGSPVFLPSGRVAAVHNMARPEENKQTEETKWIPHGIRADCVLELLVHHGLQNKVPFPIDKSTVLVERWLKPDPRTEKARADLARASALVIEAENLRILRRFEESKKKCDDALAIADGYSPALYTRSVARHAFVSYANPNRETALKILELGYKDAVKAGHDEPSDPKHLIHVCRLLNHIASLSGDTEQYQRSVVILDNTLTSKNLPDVLRADALAQRAFVRNKRGETDAALADYNEAIRLMPDNPDFYQSRAELYAARGLNELAATDRAKAREVRAWSVTGVKITEVADESPAIRGGLRVDDIIIKVGATRVHSVEELSSALGAVKGAVELVYYRDGKRGVLSVTPADGKMGVSGQPAEVK